MVVDQEIINVIDKLRNEGWNIDFKFPGVVGVRQNRRGSSNYIVYSKTCFSITGKTPDYRGFELVFPNSINHKDFEEDMRRL